MKYNQSIIDLIGNTPLIKLNGLLPDSLVFAKCEFLNPMSVKDRPVLQIIEDAEQAGLLKPGSTLIEATSGNTGMAVAYIAAIKGYRAILVMSEIQSLERRLILKAYGAELILTPAEEGTAGARKRMNEILVQNPEYFYVGQHINPSNPLAHYLNTGPEIWNQTEGKIDILVAPLGTGGTICGAGRYLKEQNPQIQLIAVEPEESPYISKGIFNPHRIMGTAPGFVPKTLDKEILDEIYLVSEDQAFETCRKIAKREGVLVGHGKVIVVILADTGQRYLSVSNLFDQ
jgi:cysteine synthase A